MAASTKPSYESFLKENQLAEERQITYYVKWVKWFVSHCGNNRRNLTWGNVTAFVTQVSERLEDWQVRQVDDALSIFVSSYLPQVHGIDISKHTRRFNIPSAAGEDGWPPLLRRNDGAFTNW